MNFSYTASRFLNDVFNRSSEWRLNENLSLRMEAESRKKSFPSGFHLASDDDEIFFCYKAYIDKLNEL